MKHSVATLILFLVFTQAYSQNLGYYYTNDGTSHSNTGRKSGSDISQNLMYGISGAYKHPVKKEKLIKAKYLNDISQGYPANWIKEYVSAEIKSTCGGRSMKAVSLNNTLTKDQINILKTVDMGADIDIVINYKSVNSANGSVDIRTVNYSVTVVPETEAEYPGGYQQLVKYLKANAISKIYELNPENLGDGVVRFTVSERGAIINSHIVKSCGDQNIDNLLLDVIDKMPLWIPAEDLNGLMVKQDFQFTLGVGGC